MDCIYGAPTYKYFESLFHEIMIGVLKKFYNLVKMMNVL